MSSSSACTVGITTIQHEELEEISYDSIGNGVLGIASVQNSFD